MSNVAYDSTTILCYCNLWFSERKYTHQALTNHLDKRAATTDKVLSNIAQDAVKETLKTTAPPPTTTTTPTTTSSSYESTNSLSTAISYNIGKLLLS